MRLCKLLHVTPPDLRVLRFAFADWRHHDPMWCNTCACTMSIVPFLLGLLRELRSSTTPAACFWGAGGLMMFMLRTCSGQVRIVRRRRGTTDRCKFLFPRSSPLIDASFVVASLEARIPYTFSYTYVVSFAWSPRAVIGKKTLLPCPSSLC